MCAVSIPRPGITAVMDPSNVPKNPVMKRSNIEVACVDHIMS